MTQPSDLATQAIVKLREIVDSVAYKPGWRFRVDPGVYGPVLYIQAEVVDSVRYIREGREALTLLLAQREIPYDLVMMWGRAELVRFIRDLLIEREIHELDEFFRDRRTGELFHDPHRPPKPVPGEFSLPKGDTDGGRYQGLRVHP